MLAPTLSLLVPSALRNRLSPAAARLPRPGPLWGAYPERTAHPARRRPVRWRTAWSAERVAHAVIQRLADGPEQPPSLAATRARLARDGLAQEAVIEALTAVCRMMADRVGLSPVRAQVLCAALLLQGRLVEMDTGEGKTCAAALAAAVAGMAGAMVHVLTANEYLAARDRQGLAPLFDALGLRSASVSETDEAATRRDAYRARIVYATARCVAFDALRDQQHGSAARRSPVDALAESSTEAADRTGPPLLNGLCMAIVDEADSVLIDEAGMPLVLSEPVDDPSLRGRVWRALSLAGRLSAEQDFTPAEGVPGQWTLTDAGRERITAWSAAFGDAWRHPLFRSELIEQALQALHGLKRDVDYLVQDEQVVIIDAASGRAAGQRRWSRDLHALVALKERLPIPTANRTIARTTYPRLFARYHHVCGLSGTLHECRAELRRQYGLAVRRVPRAHPLRRRVRPMRVFANRTAQFDAAIRRAGRLAALGRAVLLVTDSVQDTQRLAAACAAARLAVTELSAPHEAIEARVIAEAGQPGRITVTTQMAGRGTDIALSGRVRDAGGLHILSLQHNRSARVDRQVAGRAARRGDPGSFECWIRLDDSPLAPARLPMALRPLGWLAARAARTGRGQERAATLLLRAWQYWCEHDDRDRRSRLDRHDRHWSRALSFTRIKV